MRIPAKPGRDFKPILAYQYRDKRGKKSPTSANRELEVLSHAFTKAIEWGYREDHPMIEGKFRKLPTPPRSRYVEDWEIAEALSLEPRRKRGSLHAVRAHIKIKLLTGLRRSDLLRLRKADLQDDGIHVQPRKTAATTGKKLIIEWSPALRQAADEALPSIRKRDRSGRRSDKTCSTEKRSGRRWISSMTTVPRSVASVVMGSARRARQVGSSKSK